MNREPMGRLIFKDGRDEPIVFYHMFNVQYVEFFTESGAFSYENFSEPKFYEHVVSVEGDQWDDIWFERNDIRYIEMY